MKKILMITALCAVIISSVGCKKNQELEQEVNNPNTNIEENVDNNQEENNQSGIGDGALDIPMDEQPVEDNGQSEVVESDMGQSYLKLEEIANGINENSGVQISAPFNMEITAEAAFTYVGLSEEDYKDKVEVGIATESMMMPSNHSFCLLKVKEGTDISALKQTIYDNCNPRKWICMGAEYVLVAGKDNYVMLAMSSKDNCKNLLKAFESKIGKDENVLQRVAEEV